MIDGIDPDLAKLLGGYAWMLVRSAKRYWYPAHVAMLGRLLVHVGKDRPYESITEGEVMDYLEKLKKLGDSIL